MAKQEYEVFFPIKAMNNPNGKVPNWFYYWTQLYKVKKVKIIYDKTFLGYARTPGMTDWRYDKKPEKNIIIFGTMNPSAGRSYNVGKYFSGIDWHISTIIHEMKHIEQIKKADQILSSNGNDSFRYGWSWNQKYHNHWKKGKDNCWGKANIDDDKNGKIDDADVMPPFEPGHGDDISLDHPKYVWWPKNWKLPNPNNAPHPIESEAVNASDSAMNDGDYAIFDWANPGKQHKTLLKWDD